MIEQEEFKTRNAEEKEVERAGRRTLDTVKAGEQLIEALEIGIAEDQKMWEWEQELAEVKASMSKAEIAQYEEQGKPIVAKPAPHQTLAVLKLSPSEHIFNCLQKIKASDFEEALMVIPFHLVLKLLGYLEGFMRTNKKTEMVCKAILFLLKIHHKQLVAYKLAFPEMESLKETLHAKLRAQKDLLGFNRAALEYLKREIESKTSTEFYDVAQILSETKKKKDAQKRKAQKRKSLK